MTEHSAPSINLLREFAPSSPALVFRPVDMGSPQQDWARHLAENPLYRRELEEFAVLGDTVVRFADGLEPAPAEKVKLMSLAFAVKALGNETDALEFVRCVKAIASPDAGQFELEQIAAYYLKEIRRRGVADVLKEMGLLGMRLQAVTALVEDRELERFETDAPASKPTVADQRRVRKTSGAQPPLPEPTPNFDEELAHISAKLRRPAVSANRSDEFAEYLLSDEGKSIDELDADFAAFARFEQYDENGLIGLSMDAGRHSVVMFDLACETDASYLPPAAAALANEMTRLFVGHSMGGDAVLAARRELCGDGFAAGKSADASLPFSDREFSDWLDLRLDQLYPRRAIRSVRRVTADSLGNPLEYETCVEINPEFDEMSYVSAVCRAIWAGFKTDFHLRSLRRIAYQELHRMIRGATDTAELASIKKRAYAEFKERGALSLKEFTALNTAAKSQEARIARVATHLTEKTLAEIAVATAKRLRFLKFYLYNDAAISALTRQEKQRLWDAVRSREVALASEEPAIAVEVKKAAIRTVAVKPVAAAKQTVRVYPRGV